MEPCDPLRDRRASADALFDAALEQPAAERRGFVMERCGGRPDLQREVLQLLDEADRPAPVLENGCIARILPDLIEADETGADGPGPGDTIGTWRIVRLLGRGGMGSVFLVERADGHFAQTAALKLLRPGLDSGPIVRRFERERQILASLSHASIARLLDGGRTVGGRPYFVMEYVEGGPVDRDCDVRRLTIDQRLAVFAEVCRAVQYAHARLVVHLDVKPSNIFVTDTGEIKLLDFGIARIIEPVLGGPVDATAQAATILTPDYASPEQVRGDPVSTGSDVYQLGLLLYELLTGERAQRVHGRSLRALEHAICEATPVRPSERVLNATDAICEARRLNRRGLSRRLRGDLDAIVGVALRKEPDRRYSSVAELLGEVERFWSGRPIRARRDSLSYRGRRFVARHRAAFGFAAVLLAIIITVLPMVMRAAREEQRARELEHMLGRLFTLPDPPVPPRPWSAADFIENAARLVRDDLPAQTARQARLLTLLGRASNWLGRYPTSAAVLQEALAIREREFGPDSSEAAEAREWLALAQHYSGQYAVAEENLRRAASIREGRFGPDDPQTLDTVLELGDLMHSRGALVSAESVLQQTVARVRALRAPDEMLARGLQYYANALGDRGRDAEAAAAYREAIALFRAGDDAAPNQRAALAQLYFGRFLVRRHALAEAERVLHAALDDLRIVYAGYGGEHPVIVTALRELAYLRIEQGRFDEAASLLDQSQRIAVAWLGAEHPMVARTAVHEAELARRRGQFAAAVAMADRTLAQFSRLGLSMHPAAIDLRWTLAQALLALGQRERAVRELSTCLAAAVQQYVPGDERIARVKAALERISVRHDVASWR